HSLAGLQVQMDFERSLAEAEILRLKTESLERQSQELRQAYQTLQALGEIGRGITATLKAKVLLAKIHEILKGLVDTTVFGLALHRRRKGRVDYKLFVEEGETKTPFRRAWEDLDGFAVWCLENRQPLLIRDTQEEGARYLKTPASSPESGKI